MAFILAIILLVLCGVLMFIERRGVRTTLELHFKGDLKRESRWFAQYGQSACTPVVFLLLWDLDPRGWKIGLAVVVPVIVSAILVMLMKRLIGRVRPGRENAGKFLGPSWKHANYRESFPSSHTACAITLSAMLSHYYPEAATTFWMMAIICAALRYLLDAHWPSDVVGGAFIGISISQAAIHLHG